MYEARNSGEDVAPSKERLSVLHELSDGIRAISDELLQLTRNECCRLRLVKLEAPSEPFLC